MSFLLIEFGDSMRLVINILSNTPIWAYVLFIYLVWQGIGGLRTRTIALWRALLVPTIFLGLGIWRLTVTPNLGWKPLSAWLLAAIVFASLALLRGPRVLAVDKRNGTITRPGSFAPLVRNVSIFVVQYALAVAAAMHLDTQGAGAIASRAVSGATAGYFIGWSLALLRSYNGSEAPQSSIASDRST
jgi:hypothetical protein